MDNLIINIRFFYYHLQVTKSFKDISVKRNNNIKSLKGLSKLRVFKFFNYSYKSKAVNVTRSK